MLLLCLQCPVYSDHRRVGWECHKLSTTIIFSLLNTSCLQIGFQRMFTKLCSVPTGRYRRLPYHLLISPGSTRAAGAKKISRPGPTQNPQRGDKRPQPGLRENFSWHHSFAQTTTKLLVCVPQSYGWSMTEKHSPVNPFKTNPTDNLFSILTLKMWHRAT